MRFVVYFDKRGADSFVGDTDVDETQQTVRPAFVGEVIEQDFQPLCPDPEGRQAFPGWPDTREAFGLQDVDHPILFIRRVRAQRERGVLIERFQQWPAVKAN